MKTNSIENYQKEISELKKDSQKKERKIKDLKKEDDIYKSIFETNKAIKLLIDPETGKIIKANSAASNFYGYSVSEMKKMKITDINILPEKQVHIDMKKAIEEKKLFFQFKHRLASGEIRDVEVFSGPVTIQGKRLLYSIIHDVTKKKKAQREMKIMASVATELVKMQSLDEIYKYTAETIYKLLNENCIVTVVDYNFKDNSWHMQHISGLGKNLTEVSEMLGLDLNKLSGKISTQYYQKVTSGKLEEIEFDLPGLLNNRFTARMGNKLRKMLSLDKIFCITFKQNDEVYGNVTIISNKSTPKIEANLIETFVAQVSLFIQKKLAEDALKTSEERFRKFMDFFPGAVFIKDEQQKLVFCNNQYAALLNSTPQELIGKVNDEYLPDATVEKYRLENDIVMQEGEVLNIESEFIGDMGKSFWLTKKFPVRDEKGNQFLGAVSIDITEKKELEKQLHNTLLQNEQQLKQKLNAILSPQLEVADLDLEEIIDVEKVQALIDNFYKITNIGVGLLNLEGRVLVKAGWQEICTNYHRLHPETARNCMESDTELSSGVPEGELKLYKCKNNMWDIVTPIMIGGKHLGNLFLGQFFFDDEILDESVFREQAEKYNFNKKEYLAALQKVPVWSRKKVNDIMIFYRSLADMISQLSFSNLKLAKTLEDQKISKQQALESEAKFRQLAENLQQVLWLTDWKSRKLIYVNPAFQKVFELDIKEAYNDKMNWQKVIHPEDKVRVQKLFYESALEEKYVEAEYRIITKSGKEKWIYDRSYPIFDEKGKLVRFVSIADDITKRKLIELDIKQQEENLQNIIAAIPDALTIIDAETGKCLEVNQAFCTSSGWKKQEVIGKVASDINIWQDPQRRNDMIAALQKKGSINDFEAKFSRKNGEVFTGTMSANIINIKGRTCIITVTKDISRRVEIEKNLEESEEKYRNIFDNAPVGIFHYDENGVITDCNEHFVDIIGSSREALLGLDMLTRSRNKEIIKEVKKSLQNGMGHFEDWYTSITGKKTTFLRILFKGLVDEKGRIIAGLGIVNDITKRKTAESELINSEQRLRTIFDNAPVGIIHYDKNGIIHNCNEAFSAISGAAKNDVIGINVFDLPNKKAANEFKAAIEKGTGSYFGWYTSVSGNKTSFIKANFRGLKDVNGKYSSAVGIVHDLTLQEQAKMEIEKSEKKYKTVINNMSEGIFILQDMICVFANPAISRITGYPLDELLGHHAEKMLFEEDIPQVIQSYTRRMKGEKIPAYDIRVKTKSGKPIWISLYGTPIEWEGKTAMEYFAVDVTERRRAEELIKQSERQLKKAQTIGKIGDWIFDINTGSVRASEEAYNLYGIEIGQKMTIQDILQIPLPQYRERLDAALEDLINRKKDYAEEFKIRRKNDGKILDIRSIAEYNSETKQVIGIIQDITARKEIENSLNTSLEEKNLLLRELYHRTKNNMQVIASMLKIQARQAENTRFQLIIQEVVNKIQAMSLVHQKLYEAQNLSEINLKEYLEEFIVHLMHSYKLHEDKIKLDLNLKDVSVSIDVAVPLGLVITELVSNVFKHAFPKDMKGNIKIELPEKKKDTIKLILQDDGIGVAKNFDLRKDGNMGLKNVFNLVEYQLRGNVNYTVENGIRWEIKIEDNLYKKRI